MKENNPNPHDMSDQPKRNVRVEVVGTSDLYALTHDPFLEGLSHVNLLDTAVGDPSLAKGVKTDMHFTQHGALFNTDIALSRQKIARDGGFYSLDKRAEIAGMLEEQGIKHTHGGKFALEADNPEAGTFKIAYGSPSKEDDINIGLLGINVAADSVSDGGDQIREAAQNRLLEDGVYNEKTSITYRAATGEMDPETFANVAKRYGKVCETVINTLYKADELEAPQLDLILAPKMTM